MEVKISRKGFITKKQLVRTKMDRDFWLMCVWDFLIFFFLNFWQFNQIKFSYKHGTSRS